MRKIYLSLFILLIFTPSVNSQTSAILENYIRQGLDKNLALQQKNLNLEKSIEALKEANGMFFPSVEFNANYTLANGGRSIEFPVGDLLNPIYSSLNEILQNSGQQGNFPQIENQEIQFLQSDYQDTKLRIIIPLVNAEIYYNKKIKKEMISSAQAETNVYKRELVKEIKTAYFRYLQSIKIVEAYGSAKELVAEALRVNEKLVKNQMVGNDKLLRIKAEMSMVEAQFTKAENDTKTAGSYLNFLINEPLNTPIPLDSALLNNLDLLFVAQVSDVNQTREEILQLNSSVNATQQLLNMKQSYWIPSIVNVTDLGYQGYQYKLDAEQRYFVNFIEFKWNLFNGFQNQRRISQAHIDLNSIGIKLTETEKQIELQTQLAENNLQSSVKAEKANQSSLESSAEYYNIINREYAEGQKSLLDLLDARNQLTSSSINHSVSHFETLIRKVELERALASYELE